MDNTHLSTRLLDTAIKAMERNRTLLFTINLIAALILATVYLDRYSFDKKQGMGYLMAYQGYCVDLNSKLSKLPNWNTQTEDDKKIFGGCSDLNKMRGFVVANTSDQGELESISNLIFKLHVIQNEMSSTKLPTGSITPLGIGLPIPRNDMVLILGFLLVILYAWLAFSFEQLARITAKITKLFPEPKLRGGEGAQATVSDLVELNFVFRTSKPGIATVLVKVLYFLAPIALTVATINDLYAETTKNYEGYLKSILQAPLMIQSGMAVILWVIGYNINKSDEDVNIVATDDSADKKTSV